MQSVLSVVKPVVILLDVLLFGTFVYALKNGIKYRPHFKPHGHHKKVPTVKRAAVEQQWNAIQKKLEAGTVDGWKIAIIDADKLVDSILKIAGLKGEHMAERLTHIASDGYASYHRLWEAHRLRNQLVHSPDFAMSRQLAEKTLGDYEAFLKEIGVL